MLYFAYGINTNTEMMKERCPTAIKFGNAVLDGYLFEFSLHADVVKSSRSSVHGLLWQITDDDLDALDFFEGYPYYYQRKIVEVNHHGKMAKAIVYYMTNKSRGQLPNDRYLHGILHGYATNKIPTEQVTKALRKYDKTN